jgi:DNA-binding NarL/FixJ family response regulator
LLYGEMLRRDHRRVDARRELRAAHELLTRTGMAGFAERAHRELIATGETLSAADLPTADPLTEQERSVALLAREGLTNRQIGERLFLSAHTVEWHLRKVFRKLGVKSRTDLRSALPAEQSDPETTRSGGT